MTPRDPRTLVAHLEDLSIPPRSASGAARASRSRRWPGSGPRRSPR